jgi:hypothetical protein
MLPLTSAAPTTAEGIRSVCTWTGGALLAIESEDARNEPVASRYITCCLTGPSP